MSGQETGGTQRLHLTVAVFRPWRGSTGSAAPGLPGREEGYSNPSAMSTMASCVNKITNPYKDNKKHYCLTIF